MVFSLTFWWFSLPKHLEGTKRVRVVDHDHFHFPKHSHFSHLLSPVLMVLSLFSIRLLSLVVSDVHAPISLQVVPKETALVTHLHIVAF